MPKSVVWSVDVNEKILFAYNEVKLVFDSLEEMDEFMDDLADARNEIADQIYGKDESS